ncbi:hypothetical protein ACFFK7_12310 [Pseudoalteromonas xiamenensis]|uniref:hypothetical protein n=1 Tax=Pseudoalteromonas xiamenensis TaxID=882626 RepID=UPI0035EAD4A1
MNLKLKKKNMKMLSNDKNALPLNKTVLVAGALLTIDIRTTRTEGFATKTTLVGELADVGPSVGPTTGV